MTLALDRSDRATVLCIHRRDPAPRTRYRNPTFVVPPLASPRNRFRYPNQFNEATSMKLRSLCATMVQTFCLTAIGISLSPMAQAQTASSARSTVTTPVSDSKMITLVGNVRPEANAANDRGAVSGDLQLEHMLLQLNRPAELETALTARIESMSQP